MRRRLTRTFLASTAASVLLGLSLAACSSPEQKAKNYYAEGQELLQKHEYTKAGLEFKNALQLKKNMIEAWRGLLEVENHAGNAGGVVQVLRNIVELDPKDVGAKLKLGHLMMAGGDVQKALELANGATALEPKNASAIAFRASVLLKMDNAVEARAEAHAALDLDPNNSEALIVLAADRVRQKDLNGALAILNQHADVHEKDLGVQLFKLSLYEQLGDKQNLEKQFQKLIALYPKEVEFRRRLAAFYVDQKRFDDAETQLRAISDMQPDNVEAGLGVVRLLQQTKGPDAARNELLARIKAGKQAVKYRLALASFDFSQGHADQSIKELQALISESHSQNEINDAKVELARVQVARKDTKAASALIAEVLKQDSQNTDALMLRANLLLDQGKTDPAINDLRQALNNQPRSTDLMLMLGSAYERSGSIDLAEKEYASAAQGSNYAPAAVLRYVGFLRRRGNLEHAEDVLVEATRRSPQNIPLLTSLAEVRLNRQNWAGAQAVAETIQKIKGAEGLGYEVLAAALNGQGQFDKSIKLLEGVHSAAPNAPQPMVALVNTMLRAGKSDDAQALLKTVLHQNPKNTQALLLLGSVQFQQKQVDQAEASFRAAVQNEPKNPGGYIALSQLYMAEKKPDAAEKIIRTGLEQVPDNPALHENLAGILQQTSKVDQAIAEYEYLLKQEPGSLVIANNLASLLSDHRSDKKSIDQAYSLALMLAKSPLPSFKDTLGWVTYLHGDTKEAVKLLEQAAAAMPDHAIVQYHLGVVYQADKRNDKARDQFAKALKISNDQNLTAKIKAADEKLGM